MPRYPVPVTRADLSWHRVPELPGTTAANLSGSTDVEWLTEHHCNDVGDI